MTTSLPPVTRIALAYAAGAALPLLGAPLPPAPLALLLLALPIALSVRPGRAGAAVVVFMAGFLAGAASESAAARDCRLHLPERWEGEVTGAFLTRVEPGRSLPFHVEEGLPGGCRGVLRAVVPRGLSPGSVPRAGQRLSSEVRWERRGAVELSSPEWAGRLALRGDPTARPGGGLAARARSLRGAVQERIARLWEDDAPMVEALVLARREHLDPELRAAFGLSGTAHLLAISGFHVGVVAGLLVGLLRLLGARPRRAFLGAVVGCWLYVLGIGAPHAAVRAAVILTLLASSRARGWPVVPVGALGTALLGLLVLDPSYLRSVGFQLSFAGTAGLVVLRAPVARWIDGRTGKGGVGGGDGGPSSGSGAARFLKGSADGVAAGVAATLPTLPLLAWHFDRVSLIGIPATLLIAPPVAAAIPGVAASLLLSLLPGPLAGFLAGGVGLLLRLVGEAVIRASELPGSSLWISRSGLFSVCLGAFLAWVILRRLGWGGRIGPSVRGGAAAAWGGIFLLVLPLLPGGNHIELHMISVGQGDALALRSPAGRWIVVDAGPRGPGFDAGERRVVPYLRRQGVRYVEALVLTHPHLDHLGGAPALLRELGVRGVLDPARPEPYPAYLETMEAAREGDTSWWTAEEGTGFTLDGVEVRVLHPDRETRAAPRVTDVNDLSIVLLIRFGRAAILLTGDAYAPVESRILDDLPRLSVLKAGHHGSRTSTSGALLDRTRPELVLIPVGDGNRFGHPHDEVIGRLEARGIPVARTDQDGTVRVRLDEQGRMRVRTGG